MFNGEVCKDGKFIELDITIPMPKEEEPFFDILNDYTVLSERSEIVAGLGITGM